MPKTTFDPKLHGFHFSNNDIKWTIGLQEAPLAEGKALCGGMAYAALDYFIARSTIPPVVNAPVEGTPLHKYIYDRQTAAHVNTIPKFVGSFMPFFGPLVSHGALNPENEYNRLVQISGPWHTGAAMHRRFGKGPSHAGHCLQPDPTDEHLDLRPQRPQPHRDDHADRLEQVQEHPLAIHCMARFLRR